MMGNGGEGCCRPEPPQEDRQGEQEDGESLVIRRNHAGEEGKGDAREAGRRGFGGDSPCWVRAIWARQSAGREALVRRCPPRGFLTGCSPGSLEEPWGGQMSFHNFPTPPPTTLRLSASPFLTLK